jgi:response regulator RpfG family c-di-GMP phosphodiesterase
MSSDRPIEEPSSQTEPTISDPALANLVREMGEPLLEGLEAHIPGSIKRAEAVGAYALAAAVGLGFARPEAELCRQAARLGDIGTIYVPADVLARDPSTWTDEEREVVAGRFEAGARLAEGAGLPSAICEWLLRASEHYDGSGPAGLSGTDIPVFSRIIRTAKRCDEVIGEGSDPSALLSLAGTELDPAMVNALVSMLTRDETSKPGP